MTVAFQLVTLKVAKKRWCGCLAKFRGSVCGRFTYPWIYRTSHGQVRPSLGKHTWSPFYLKCHIPIVTPENRLRALMFNQQVMWRVYILMVIPLCFTIQSLIYIACSWLWVSFSVCLSLLSFWRLPYSLNSPPSVFTYLGHLLCVTLFSWPLGRI